jgi:hypothetical protein
MVSVGVAKRDSTVGQNKGYPSVKVNSCVMSTTWVRDTVYRCVSYTENGNPCFNALLDNLVR